MKKILKTLIVLGIISGCIYLLWKPICTIFSAIYKFIQTNTIFTSNLFNFIIVIAFFIWLLFKVVDIMGILDKKRLETVKTITNSENKKAEAENHLVETQKSLENIDSEVKNILTEAKNTARNIENNSENYLKQELENLKSREKLLNAAQINKAKSEVSIVIANAAIAVSEEYIKNSLDDDAHRELINNFIDDLDEGMKL